MRLRSISLTVLFCLLSAHTFAAKVPYPKFFSSPPIKRFNPASYPQFNLIDRELHNLVEKAGHTEINNLFCVSGFLFPNGKELATVIWANEGIYYFWDGAFEEYLRAESITLFFSKFFDLRNPLEDGIAPLGTGNMYRSQAESIIEDCEKYGQKYLIRPFTPAPPKSEDE